MSFDGRVSMSLAFVISLAVHGLWLSSESALQMPDFGGGASTPKAMSIAIAKQESSEEGVREETDAAESKEILKERKERKENKPESVNRENSSIEAIKRQKKQAKDELQKQEVVNETKPKAEKREKESQQAQVSEELKASTLQESVVEPISEIPVVNSNVRYRQPPSPPIYPHLAVRKKQQGETWVRALVNTQGEIEQIVIARSSGYELLDQSALDAVSGWLFEAAEVDGRTVTAWVEVPVAFELHRSR